MNTHLTTLSYIFNCCAPSCLDKFANGTHQSCSNYIRNISECWDQLFPLHKAGVPTASNLRAESSLIPSNLPRSTPRTKHIIISPRNIIRSEPNLTQKLLGTTRTWFLFDTLFYSNTLVQPKFIDDVFRPLSLLTLIVVL